MRKYEVILIVIILLSLTGCSNNAGNLVNELENEVVSLSSQIEELSTELADIKVENAALNNQVDSLLEEVRKASENEEIIESLKKRIDELVNEKPTTLEEFEENKRMEIISANYIEDTFAKVINYLERGKLERANELSLNDLSGFKLPESDFYYARDYISIALEESRADAIYEVFDSETDKRIYFITVSLIKEGYTWYVDRIESTMEPG